MIVMMGNLQYQNIHQIEFNRGLLRWLLDILLDNYGRFLSFLSLVEQDRSKYYADELLSAIPS